MYTYHAVGTETRNTSVPGGIVYDRRMCVPWVYMYSIYIPIPVANKRGSASEMVMMVMMVMCRSVYHELTVNTRDSRRAKHSYARALRTYIHRVVCHTSAARACCYYSNNCCAVPYVVPGMYQTSNVCTRLRATSSGEA